MSLSVSFFLGTLGIEVSPRHEEVFYGAFCLFVELLLGHAACENLK